MLHFRKTLVFGLVLALIIVLPCWSRGSTGSSGGAASSNWRYQKGGPISETPVTISVLTHTGWAANLAVPNNNLPVYAAMMRRLGINVDWQILENATYWETVFVRLMSRNLPDMAVFPDNVNNAVARMVEDRSFLAFTDLNWAENAPYTQDLFRDPEYAPLEQVFKSIYGDGKIYSFGNLDIPRFMFSNILVNNVWLRNLGLSEPNTLDEFYNMLVAFRDNDPNRNGRRDEIPMGIYGVNSMQLAFAGIFGVDFHYGWELDRNGRLVSSYTTDKYRDYLEFRKRLYDNDLIDKEGRDLTANFELAAADRLGSIAYFGSYSQEFTEYSPSYNASQGNYVFRELLPLYNPYSGKREKLSRLAAPTDEGLFILSGARYPEVCLRFADWLWASPDYEMLMNFGVEGLSYDIINGVITPKEPPNYRGNVPYLISIGGDQPPWAHRQSEAAWRLSYPKWMNDRADEIKPFYVDGLMPAVLSPSDQTLAARYRPDVDTFRSEMRENFITGRRPLSQYNDYVRELNALGMDRLREIYQKYH